MAPTRLDKKFPAQSRLQIYLYCKKAVLPLQLLLTKYHIVFSCFIGQSGAISPSCNDTPAFISILQC